MVLDALLVLMVGMLIGVLIGWNVPKPGPKARSASAGPVTTAEIYVGNLSPETTEERLREALASFGKVESLRIIANRFDGQNKHFAFVSMGSPDQARAAIRGLNGRDLQGRRIVISEARSRQRRRGR